MPPKVVGATYYGGPSDPSSGTHGYKGDDLRGKSAYAELGMGHALGGLPYKTKLKITNLANKKSVVAEKLDIGLGGGPIQGHTRAIDLWYETAAAIGFNGYGLVSVEYTNDPTATVGGSTSATVSGGNPTDASTTDPGSLGCGSLGLSVIAVIATVWKLRK